MNVSSKTKKFGQSPVAAACVSLLIGMASSGALAQSATFGVTFPVAAVAATIDLGNFLGSGTYGLNQDFTTVTGLTGVNIAVQSVQTLYSSGGLTLKSTVGSGDIVNIQNGGGTVTANVSNNSIAASSSGNQVTLASGGTVATIDLGLMATNKSIGALAVQYLGSEYASGGQVNVRASVSGSTVGALFNYMSAAPIAVNSNNISASATLNEATTVVAGAVPLGFANSTGGSSTILSNAGTNVQGTSVATLNINTLQASVNGGISAGSTAGSGAELTNNTIAIKTQETSNGPNLSSSLTLNNNTQSAAFTGNKATNLVQANSNSNAFSGSASVTNAQANVETLDYASGSRGPTALVSNSQIVADLTYVGVVDGLTGAPYPATPLTSSLSVSGTALAPQAISAQSIGNAAGSLNSAGQITSSGNAIEFSSANVNLTGSADRTDVVVAAGNQTTYADVLVNSAQVNQRPNASGSGVSSLVSGSGITAAVDQLAAIGSVTVNHNAVTAGATGNLAANLINAKANNVSASMAVVGTQQNIHASVSAQNILSSIGAGIGYVGEDSTTYYTVAERALMTPVLGSVTVNNNAIGAVAQGNLAANNLLVAAGGMLTALNSGGGEGYSVENHLSGGGATVGAGLMAVNVQVNDGSAATARVLTASIAVSAADQAGLYVGNLVPIGAATVTASSNTISALAQGNNGGTNIGVTAGSAIVLTAAAANSQNNNSSSPVDASVEDSQVRIIGLSSLNSTLTSNSNTVAANASGNLAVNAISVSGGATVNGGAIGDPELDPMVHTLAVQSLQGNAASITADALGSGVGVLLGAASSNSASLGYGYSTSGAATWADPGYRSSADSTTDGNFTQMLGQNITTVTGATLAVNNSTVAARASANQVNNSASLAGTTLGNIAPVASVIGSEQNNSGAVSSRIDGSEGGDTVVGVRLVGQDNTVTSTPTYGNTAATSNTYDGGEGFSNVNLSAASAVAANNVSGSAAGSITAIDTTTASVSTSSLVAASNGNVATNLLRLNGTNVALQGNSGGAALDVYNNQYNTGAGISSSVAHANVGVLLDAVTGTGTSTLKGTVTATVQPTTDYVGPAGLYSGSGSATISTPVVGSMAATGINALTATVDASVLSATSIANSADNRIIIGASALTTGGWAPNAQIQNYQENRAIYSAELGSVNLGVVLATVTAGQTTETSGSATTTVAATANGDGNSVVNGAVASTTLSASGSATALGISGSNVSVQGSALSASAKGNTVTNVIDLGSTVANNFGVSIRPEVGLYGQENSGNGSTGIAGVTLGVSIGAVDSTSTSTSTANATGSGSATDTTNASVTVSTATASGSATAVATTTALRNSTSTVSGNSVTAIGFGNEAINVVSGSGTVISGPSYDPAVDLKNSQYNTGDLTAAVGASWVTSGGSTTLTALAPIQLGTLVGAVTAGGHALVTSTASGSATAAATATSTNGESTTANFASSAVANAYATVNATGISGLTAATDGNRVEAANTGNSAINAIRMSGTTITGGAHSNTLFNENSQEQTGALTASVGNIALGVMLTSVEAIGSASGLASAVASGTATDSNTASWASGSASYTGNTASATASGGATAFASGSATAIGMEATNASVSNNVLRAANTGNSATTVTSLSASSLTGALGSLTVDGANRSQQNYGSLSATLGSLDAAVTVGVSGGAVTATFNASGSATATSTGSTTAWNWYDTDPGAPVVNASHSTATPTLTTSATATAEATATATGMTGSTFNVLSNQLSASNVANSAYTAATLDGTVLGTALLPVSAYQYNEQTNYSTGVGTATASNIMLGVLQADVTASASGSASYTSSTGTYLGSNDATATASAYGIVNSTLNVGGTQAALQTVTAQSVGNSASTLIAVTQTTGAGPSGGATLEVRNSQFNSGNQTATVGELAGTGSVTVGVKVGAVTANADANVSQSYLYGGGSSGWNETADATAVGISGSSVAVQFNQLAALSYGNSASNGLASTTTTSLGGSTAAVPTFLVDNWQTNEGETRSTLAAANIGVIVGNVTANASGWSNDWEDAVAINASQLNVSNNQALATSIGNVAYSAAAVTAGVAGTTALPVSSLVHSFQRNLGAQTTLVDNLRVGVFTGAVSAWVDSYGILGSSLTVAGNQVQAATYGNRANSVNEVLAATTASIGAVTTQNEQSNEAGGAQSSTISNTTVGVGISSAENALSNTPTTVQSNTLAALSYGNSASNTTLVSGGTTLTATSVGPAFVTSNLQTNRESLTSLADNIMVGVSVLDSWTGIEYSPTVVKDNAVSVLAYANQASNSLSLTAGNMIDGNDRLAKVSSIQTNESTGYAVSTLQNAQVGVITDAAHNVEHSNVTVDGNRLTAASYLNTASNTLNLTAQVLGGADSTTPATVTNWQSNAASGSATVSVVNVGVLPCCGANLNSQVLNDVTSSVSNNALNAQAGGNTAQNVLNATASTTIVGVSGPIYQVLNAQSNSGVMTALLDTARIGNWGDSGSNYYGPTTMSVSMNAAMANSYGNTASNTLNMSALTGASNGASASLSNSQNNTANLTATVSNVQIGVGSGSGAGIVSVSGNSILASTVGNAVSNSIGVKR